MSKKTRTRLLEEIQQTLENSPLFRVIGFEEQEIDIDTLSRYRTPLIVITPEEETEVNPVIGNVQSLRYNLPVRLTVVVNADDIDEMEALDDYEFEVKRVLYLDRRRGTYAISTDFVSRNEPIDLFDESVYKGMDLSFNVLYQENLTE